MDKMLEYRAVGDVFYAGFEKELREDRAFHSRLDYFFPVMEAQKSISIPGHIGLAGIDEVRAYLSDPVLRDRLENLCRILLSFSGSQATGVLVIPYYRHLMASMTLFAEAEGRESLYDQVLQKYFRGEREPMTLWLLRKEGDRV